MPIETEGHFRGDVPTAVRRRSLVAEAGAQPRLDPDR
jgi:hypothetical protein